jgi:hypothetical protein
LSPPLRHALRLQRSEGWLAVENEKALCAHGGKGQLED